MSISLLLCTSNAAREFEQVCDLQVPQIFQVPLSLSSILLQLSCHALIRSCLCSFSFVQTVFYQRQGNCASQARHDLNPLFSAIIYFRTTFPVKGGYHRNAENTCRINAASSTIRLQTIILSKDSPEIYKNILDSTGIFISNFSFQSLSKP